MCRSYILNLFPVYDQRDNNLSPQLTMLYALRRAFERLCVCSIARVDCIIFVWGCTEQKHNTDDNTTHPLCIVLCRHHHHLNQHLCQRSASLQHHMLLLNPSTTSPFVKLVIQKSVSDIAACDRKDVHCVMLDYPQFTKVQWQ